MHTDPVSALRPSVRRGILGLGISQIIGWGSTYYLLSLLAGPIGRDLGLSSGWMLGGTSMTLASAAVIGPRIGRWQDRAGSRVVMATGSIVMAAGLALLSFAQNWVGYYAAWLVIGIGAPMALYSAAFTSLTQMAGRDARRAISFLTFMGGLASTIFWPFTAWLMNHLDWRSIVLLFAALNLCICLPIHALLLSGRADVEASNGAGMAVSAGIPESAHRSAFLLFAVMLALNGLIFNSWSLLVFSVLEGIGYLAATAVFIGSLVGVFQVAGRMGEMLFAGRYSVMWTAFVSAFCLPLAFVILLAGSGNTAVGAVFAAMFGISNGLLTIARGGLTLAIFGSHGYGERLNKMTVSQNAAGAIAPILGGYLLDSLGAHWVVTLMLGTASLAFLFMLLLRRHCARNGLS